MASGPVVVWSLHIRGKVYTEVPLAALVVAAVVALALSEGFRRRIPSVLLGVVLGLGLLTKWSFAFFMGIPAALAGCARCPAKHRVGASGLGRSNSGGAGSRVCAGGCGAVDTLRTHDWLLAGTGAGAGFGRDRLALTGDVDRAGLVNVGLCVMAVTAVARPWYWSHLASMQEFLAANMAQKYYGDPVSGLAAWPFYPSVLATRVMSTPLLSASSRVSARVSQRLPPRWCAEVRPDPGLRHDHPRSALPLKGATSSQASASWPSWVCGHGCSGTDGEVGCSGARPRRYIQLDSLRSGRRVPAASLGCALLFLRTSWGTRHGIYAAYQDLLRPRWRFLPVPNPPVLGQSESRVDGVGHCGHF